MIPTKSQLLAAQAGVLASQEVARERADRMAAEGVPFLIAKIVSSSSIATNRWEYSWKLAEIGSTSSKVFTDVTDAWYQGTAYNVCEGINTSTLIGPGYLPANIPAGFALKPVEGYVVIFPHRLTNGGDRWFFCVPNAIDGQCDAASLVPLIQGDCHVVYDDPNLSWRFDPACRVWLRTECTTAGDYTTNTSGTGAAVTFADTFIHENYHVGIAQCASGTTTTGRACVVSPTFDCIQLGSGAVYFKTMVKTPSSLSDATNRYNLIAGLHDNIASGATASDGVYLAYRDNLNGGKWQATTYSTTTGTTTAVDTGISVVASTWYCLEIRINAAATSATFYIDDALVATITTDIPSGSSDQTGICVGIRKGAGTTSRSMFVDYVDFTQDLTRCGAS